MKKWQEQDYLKFIQLYEEHPCLWNTDLPEHKDGAKKKQAIKTIIAKMGIPNFGENDCKKKINRVRTAYGIEVRYFEASKKHGRVYKTSLSWFGAVDKFLRNRLKKYNTIKATQGPRAERSATEVQEEESEQAEQTNSEETTEVVENSETPITIKCEDLFEEEPTKFIKQVPQIILSSQDDRGAKRRRDDDDDVCSSEDALTDVRVSEEVKTPIEVSEEFKTFGQSVAAQLKAMPIEDALRLQDEIQHLISKKRSELENKKQKI